MTSKIYERPYLNFDSMNFGYEINSYKNRLSSEEKNILDNTINNINQAGFSIISNGIHLDKSKINIKFELSLNYKDTGYLRGLVSSVMSNVYANTGYEIVDSNIIDSSINENICFWEFSLKQSINK